MVYSYMISGILICVFLLYACFTGTRIMDLNSPSSKPTGPNQYHK